MDEFDPQNEMTRKEVAALFKVSDRTIDRWAKKGLLTPSRIGFTHYVKYPREQVMKLHQSLHGDPEQ
jgi:excisionase family DNA binding protein